MIFNELSLWLVAIFLLSLGNATPIETPAAEVHLDVEATTTVLLNPYPTAEGGALDPHPLVTLTAFTDGPATYTLTISNGAGRALSTAHYVASTDTPVLSENPQPGVFAAGASQVLHVPRGWEGNVAIGEARFGLPGPFASLIEGSYKQQLPTTTDWLWAMDVSYVAGYTVPIICYCGATNVPANRLSGCSVPLFQNSACPPADFDAAKGDCRNPLKGSNGATAATPFFKPCQGQAYTYPGDHDGLANGKCQTSTTTCIILPDNGPH